MCIARTYNYNINIKSKIYGEKQFSLSPSLDVQKYTKKRNDLTSFCKSVAAEKQDGYKSSDPLSHSSFRIVAVMRSISEPLAGPSRNIENHKTLDSIARSLPAVLLSFFLQR